MIDKQLFDFTPGFSICTEAQTAPPIGLVNKYDTAKKILKERSSIVNGELLLKTVHLLSDSELVFPTVENITKSYVSELKTYYDVKPAIEEALQILVEAKVLLVSNNNYKITSDLEGKLLEEMKDFDVELYSKKRALINGLKDYKVFSAVSTFSDASDSFKFTVVSEQDDELIAGSKQLRLAIYNLFNMSDHRQDFVERIKLETQHEKGLVTLIPDNKDFSQIDKLIAEIIRYLYMEEKYDSESDPTKRQIIRNFSLIREEKEKELRLKVEYAYKNASIVYMFDELLLNEDNFKGTITEIQRRVIKNIYTKRLGSQLSEGLVSKIFSSRKEALSKLFTGDDFKFFDDHGNFIGDNLKVVEEIGAIIKARYVDGRTLESDLSGAPWHYSFGTIVSTLAALFRAGRISVKYNGETWLSYELKGVQEAFTNATKFKSASFKSITASLTAAQKSRAVHLLIDLEIELHTGRKVDWNINDFDLADSISFMAEHFIGALTTLKDTVEDFELLFPMVANQKQILQGYAGKTTEGNYIERVDYFLSNSAEFVESVQTILKTQNFIKKSFASAKDFKRFAEEVLSELKKAERSDLVIEKAAAEFEQLYKQDMVKNFTAMQQQVQLIKDSYFALMKIALEDMGKAYESLENKINSALSDLKQNYPVDLNAINEKRLNDLKRYCSDRIKVQLTLEFSIRCKASGYSLSDVLNYTALCPTKENDLVVIQSSFISAKVNGASGETQQNPPASPKSPRKVKLLVSSKVMKVHEYKSILTSQLTSLAAAGPDEDIELDIVTVG